jgi:hypothetical protein
LAPQDSPYGLGLALTQEELQQSLRLIQDISLPPLHSHNSTTLDVETRSKLIEHQGGETLHEDVGELRCRWDMEDMDLTNSYLLSGKMKINLHMLDVLMLNRVVG